MSDRRALVSPRQMWLAAAPLGFALFLACNRPSDSLRTNTSTAAIAGPAPTATGNETVSATGGTSPSASASNPADCPAEGAKPPFEDGAWSVRSLVCARTTLNVGDHFVLRAMPAGGNRCVCPENVACAPCMPYRLFRDSPGDEVFVTLRSDFRPGLADGVRVDVPVRLVAWGSAPPGALAEVVGARAPSSTPGPR